MKKHSQKALLMIWILMAMSFIIDLIFDFLSVYYIFLTFIFLALGFAASFYIWIRELKKKK